MRLYETAFLIAPNLPEEETEQLIQQMSDVVSKKKGEIVDIDKWGKRKTAYLIQKFDAAFYVFFLYKSGPDVPAELERLSKQNEKILRYLTVRQEEDIKPRKKRVVPPKTEPRVDRRERREPRVAPGKAEPVPAAKTPAKSVEAVDKEPEDAKRAEKAEPAEAPGKADIEIVAEEGKEEKEAVEKVEKKDTAEKKEAKAEKEIKSVKEEGEKKKERETKADKKTKVDNVEKEAEKEAEKEKKKEKEKPKKQAEEKEETPPETPEDVKEEKPKKAEKKED